MRRLLCYGDSNTYGYDPRSWLGDRYTGSERWTGLLGAGYEVWNAGQNGRMIPARQQEFTAVEVMLRDAAPLDLFIVMLGSNDLLCSEPAERVIEKMRQFLEAIVPALGDTRILLIAPPPLCPGAWGAEQEQIEASTRFGAYCRSLACEMGISFADAGEWEPELSFDGVHFSEAGHCAFAQGLKQTLAQIFGE